MIQLPLRNSLHLAHTFLQNLVPQGASVVDATCGNGKDTAFLAQLVGETGQVWAFDIQKQALHNTYRFLCEQGLEQRVKLIQACHSRIHCFVPGPIFACMFNLGYLPGGDHDVTTEASTTLLALSALKDMLSKGGIMSIVSYPGHPAGKQEYDKVKAYLSTWPQQEFEVVEFSFINQINLPAILLLVHKL